MPPPLTIVRTSQDTDRSTADTIQLMHACIAEAYQRPEVIEATRKALSRCGIFDPAWRKAEDIWQWVHSHIEFMPDEQILQRYFGFSPERAVQTELLQRPELLLATRRGDCDCFTMLTCAMLACAGVGYAISTVAADSDNPHRWSHVYAIALSEDRREIPMDTSHGRWFGWEAPHWYRRKEWFA